MTNTTTTQMTEMEQFEKAINKFNTAYRKAGEWNNSFFDKKIRFSKSKEHEGHREVLIGSKNWGCKLAYKIEHGEIYVTSFNPETGGIVTNFSDSEAERGFHYLFDLAAALNLNSLTIEKSYLRDENYKVFNKNGFSHHFDEDTYISRFSIDFRNGLFHTLRAKFKEIQKQLKTILKEDNTIKTEFIAFYDLTTSLEYRFSYYAHGVKGHLLIIGDESGLYMKDTTLSISIPLDGLLPAAPALDEFFETVKEEGALISLIKPSDVIFNEVAARKLDVDKHVRKEIFKLLSTEYKQSELDKRLKQDGEIITITQFQMSKNEVLFARILDIFFVYKKDKDELTHYSNEDKDTAKKDFIKLTSELYTKRITSTLNEI